MFIFGLVWFLGIAVGIIIYVMWNHIHNKIKADYDEQLRIKKRDFDRTTRRLEDRSMEDQDQLIIFMDELNKATNIIRELRDKVNELTVTTIKEPVNPTVRKLCVTRDVNEQAIK